MVKVGERGPSSPFADRVPAVASSRGRAAPRQDIRRGCQRRFESRDVVLERALMGFAWRLGTRPGPIEEAYF
jgi:hypothetical protein